MLYKKKKGKVVPANPMQAHRGSKGTVPLILNLGAKRCGELLAPVALPPGYHTSTHRKGYSVGLKVDLDVSEARKISCPCRASNPGPSP